MTVLDHSEFTRVQNNHPTVKLMTRVLDHSEFAILQKRYKNNDYEKNQIDSNWRKRRNK